MGKIRSAWEIALEKTENMEIDHEKIKHNAEVDSIRRIAGTYITGDEASDEGIKEKLSSYSPSVLREALSQTILNSIVLSQDDTGLSEKTEKIGALIRIAFHNPEILGYYIEISQHMSDYPKHKEELIKKLKEQIEPMLRQKEVAMREKYGESIHLTIENDKESMEMVKSYIDRLNTQYHDTLDTAKAEMEKLMQAEK